LQGQGRLQHEVELRWQRRLQREEIRHEIVTSLTNKGDWLPKTSSPPFLFWAGVLGNLACSALICLRLEGVLGLQKGARDFAGVYPDGNHEAAPRGFPLVVYYGETKHIGFPLPQ
jgi:hypothetical protein